MYTESAPAALRIGAVLLSACTGSVPLLFISITSLYNAFVPLPLSAQISLFTIIHSNGKIYDIAQFYCV